MSVNGPPQDIKSTAEVPEVIVAQAEAVVASNDAKYNAPLPLKESVTSNQQDSPKGSATVSSYGETSKAPYTHLTYKPDRSTQATKTLSSKDLHHCSATNTVV